MSLTLHIWHVMRLDSVNVTMETVLSVLVDIQAFVSDMVTMTQLRPLAKA